MADTAVVSVTELLTDGTRNALPGTARILGDVRSFSPAVSKSIEAEMRCIVAGRAAQHDLTASVSYAREFVPLINDVELTKKAAEAVRAVSEDVSDLPSPITASEDFARFLDHVPGTFIFIGAGEESAPLHSPFYDFNDDSLMHGAHVHSAIVRHRLAPKA